MKENKNEPAYPEICDTRNIPLFESSGGLTKLELISAMCLQGIVGNKDSTMRHDYDMMCEFAITYAKELLKQLEAEK